jgi:hypothetical protein
MRIKNKELRRRRHRKEQAIKAAVKEAKAGAKPAKSIGSAPAAKKAAAKKAVDKKPAAKKPAAKKAPAKKKADDKSED